MGDGGRSIELVGASVCSGGGQTLVLLLGKRKINLMNYGCENKVIPTNKHAEFI